MKLFLWDQREAQVESRRLLKRAVLQYETAKRNKENHGESHRDSLVVICETPSGKPYPVSPVGCRLPLHVSVTHTACWWLCAVGETPMGIDAELRSRRIKPSLARRICTARELQWLEEADDRPELFRQRLLWLWVRKEARVKYLGTGVFQGLRTVSVLECQEDRQGFIQVDLSGVCLEAEEQLLAAVYSPGEQNIEGMERLLWK